MLSPHVASEMIKVCHVAMGDLWAGAEVQLATLIYTLAKRPNLELSVVLFNEGRLASELRTIGVPVTVFPETKLNPVTLLRKLAAHCRVGRFDLLHTHKYKDNILGTIAAVLTGIPHVIRTVHGLPEPFEGRQAIQMGLYDLCDELAIRKGVSRLIAVSSQIGQVLVSRYGTEKVVRILNGIRISQVKQNKQLDELRRNLRIEPTCSIVGTVGRLVPVKGHEHFLNAAQRLLKHGQDIRFLIVGDGPLLNRLKDQASDLGISDYVDFLGFRDNTYDIMGAMDVFVLPSLHEGIPMAILEAMALARPIVSSRVGGISEVITDSVHGLLVRPGDPGELAGACLKLLVNRDLAERYGRAGQARAEREFSAESMGIKVEALYRELLANRTFSI